MSYKFTELKLNKVKCVGYFYYRHDTVACSGLLDRGGGGEADFFFFRGVFPCNLKYLEGIFIGWGDLNLPIYYVKTKSHLKK